MIHRLFLFFSELLKDRRFLFCSASCSCLLFHFLCQLPRCCLIGQLEYPVSFVVMIDIIRKPLCRCYLRLIDGLYHLRQVVIILTLP